MRIRNVLKEFEAHIRSVQPNSKVEGKSEWKQYSDGTYRFKISVRNIPLPDNTVIDVQLDDTSIAQLPVQNGKIKLDRESAISVGIPAVKEGQVIKIHDGQTALAEGKYVEE